jgi:hypothetical protein
MSITDVQEWQPKFVFGRIFRRIDNTLTYRGNFLGFLYAPLVIVDHKYVHKTRHYFPQSGTLENSHLDKLDKDN